METDVRWRMDLARRMAAAYQQTASNANVAAVMAAGSTGRGKADRYSDLEIDIYYHRPPTVAEREAAVMACGARLISMDEDADEWEEQMDFNGFHAATSTFLVGTLERYLTQTIDHFDIDPLAQARISSVLLSTPLYGEDAVAVWRVRAGVYPNELGRAMLAEYLPFHGFGYAENMLAARDDRLALYAIFTDIARQVIGALHGLNRVYLPSPNLLKNLAETTAALSICPTGLPARLYSPFHQPLLQGVVDLKVLIAEIFDLVDQHVPGFDTRPFREGINQSRPVFDGPPGLG